MRRPVISLLLLLPLLAHALTIPQGTIYFDNSKTGYSAVRFVYGSYSQPQTYALAMTQEGNKWRVDIPATVNNMYRFTFVGSDIREGLYNQDFNTFKDSISHQAVLNRTATSEAQMSAGDIFVPETGDNWAQGAWTSLAAWLVAQSGEAGISGTLPVVYLNTTNNVPITSKETYVTGSLYIDALSTGYQSLGSATSPITGQFKGRGNWTWTGFDKKPYRIKFDSKQAVLGMPKNKHFGLLAHADDCLGFLKNRAGFYLSEHVGLAWTPRMVPVELVLNGKYQGLYFLTELIRSGSDRVNITEQKDSATDSVSGGWIVEIDNYEEEGNVTFTEGNGQDVMITMKEPEILSAQQRSYIESQLYGLNDAIYGSSSSNLWSRLDLDDAARFYLVQEIMEDCESYHGSCYLYKDRDRNGKTNKWHFGPVWDFGNAYNRHGELFIYEYPIWPQYWIAQIATWPEFQAKTKQYWYTFYHSQQATLRTQLTEYKNLISAAAVQDAKVWNGTRNYCNNADMTSRFNDFISSLNWRINWLYSQWGEGIKPQGLDQAESSTDSGTAFKQITPDGRIVILRNGHRYDALGHLLE